MRRLRHSVRRFSGPAWQQQGDDVLACATAANRYLTDHPECQGIFAWHWRQRAVSEGADRQFARRVEGDSAAADLH